MDDTYRALLAPIVPVVRIEKEGAPAVLFVRYEAPMPKDVQRALYDFADDFAEQTGVKLVMVHQDLHADLELREKLAAWAHDSSWSGWTRYMLDIIAEWLVCGEKSEDLDDCPSVQRWRRQLATPYAELSEAEKESDREQADQIIALLMSEKET